MIKFKQCVVFVYCMNKIISFTEFAEYYVIDTAYLIFSSHSKYFY